MKTSSATQIRHLPETVSDLGTDAVVEVSAALRKLLADVFALYVKTKNFQWHLSGPNFRDYHLLLDEQAKQIFAMTDDIAERARKLGGTTIRSIGDISRHQRLTDNNAEFVAPRDMLVELRGDISNLHESYVPPMNSASGAMMSQPRA
jgi:starvation-inducible DNA-binding protein